MVIAEQKEILSCQDAYNLWDLTSARYEVLERMHIWSNYIHDADLSYVVDSYIRRVEERVKAVESFMWKVGVNGPDVGVVGVHTSVNTEVLRDEFIAKDVMITLQGAIEMIMRGVKTTFVNDTLRNFLIHHAREAINDMEGIILYLRLKGWLNTPPLYRNIPTGEKEVIDTGEANHLWDHLTFRYDNTHQTLLFLAYVKDPDLKAVVSFGNNILKKQAEMLEKECLRFGIPLPKHPPNVVVKVTSTELLSDDYIFRTILIGVTGAENFHVTAIKQCTTNDRLRGVFKELLLSEIDIFDKLIKYGKSKGWIQLQPQYVLQP